MHPLQDIPLREAFQFLAPFLPSAKKKKPRFESFMHKQFTYGRAKTAYHEQIDEQEDQTQSKIEMSAMQGANSKSLDP